MSASSDDFEQTIAEIYRVLSTHNTIVKWNDKIPDPDNPTQLRQIDISIKSNDFVTHVECRIHQSKQDVKWIEELYGRKESLGADSLIAVSSSGFTSGAIKKAERFGIILRDTINIKEEDLQSWGRLIKIEYEYFTFVKIDLTLCFPLQQALLDIDISDLEDFYNKRPDIIKDVLSSFFNEELKNKFINKGKDSYSCVKAKGHFEMPINIKMHQANNYNLDVYNVGLFKKEIYINKAILFGHPTLDVIEKRVNIQKLVGKGGYYIGSPGKIKLHLVPGEWQMPSNSVLISIVVKFPYGDVFHTEKDYNVYLLEMINSANFLEDINMIVGHCH